MRKTGLTAAAVLALSCGWSVAGHANLVQNPGFENSPASVAPWTVGGGGNGGVDQSTPNSGSNDAFLSSDFSNGDPTTLTQSITGLVVGDQYSVDFFLAADAPVLGDPTSTFGATLGDLDLFAAEGGSPISSSLLQPGYNEFTDTVTADASGPDLVFTGNSNSGNFYLDDVSITPVSTSPVPEPSEALLLASMLSTFAVVRRRRG